MFNAKLTWPIDLCINRRAESWIGTPAHGKYARIMLPAGSESRAGWDSSLPICAQTWRARNVGLDETHKTGFAIAGVAKVGLLPFQCREAAPGVLVANVAQW